ncbi:nucleotidyltransferase domain-containing protein [Tenacibaculum xiamenense]|uniref:nucleotidyltransferase domain-containing protein n=1 Tax=Tenacibaculum xiamenense TaxID=1261553 RepID=UPI003892F251
MNYKETLFLVGKCLTISHNERNKALIKKELTSGNVDWDNVVKLSTAHYVFPALYCNLKRCGFLIFLPEDLVSYMKHITDLNRERNKQIIAQAKEINKLLLSNNITPIFLKGTGNLLEGLYEDIAERMVGDIDFIINPNDYENVVKLFEEKNYKFVQDLKYQFASFKHYPRIHHNEKIAAVEIHKEITIEKYAKEFNFNNVSRNSQLINDVKVLGYNDQLCLSIIAKQINDNGYQYKDISFRNAYDVFLLSQKVCSRESIKNFNKLKQPLNTFLAISHTCLGNVSSITYQNNKQTAKDLKKFNKLVLDRKFRDRYRSRISKSIYFKSRLNIIIKSILNKDYRFWLIKRLTDREFRRQIKESKLKP